MSEPNEKPLSNEVLSKMWACSDLLEPPGNQVVRELITEIHRLREREERLREWLYEKANAIDSARAPDEPLHSFMQGQEESFRETIAFLSAPEEPTK